MDWVIEYKFFFTVLGWLTVGLFLVLGIACFIAATKQGKDKKSLLLKNKFNRFLLGMSFSAINPVQIPFWFTWSLSLLKENILHPVNKEYNYFTLGTGLGTIIGLAVYIYGGKWAIKKMNANNKSINKFMGVVFVGVALWQLYKMLFDSWTK